MRQSDCTQHHCSPSANVLAVVYQVVIQVMLICALPFSAWAHVSDPHEAPGPNQRISGHVVPLLGLQQPIGLPPANQPLQLSITLKLRNEDVLDRILAAQNDPTSSLYHHYLTPQEFTAQYAPTQASVDAVVAYARQQGFQVTGVSSNHLLVDATGTVASANRAFATQIKNYRLQSRVVYAPSTDPYLPEAIGANVQAIVGLNNVSTYRPRNLQRRLERFSPSKGSSGGYIPDELRTAYDVTPLLASGNDGSGQTIALFEMDGYKPSDIAAYRQHYHLGPLKATDVLVDGATNTPGTDALEVTLDMEVLSALAPGAMQRVYIGPNTVAGISDTYNRIVTDNQAKVISVSWGVCESASTPSRLDGLSTIFKQAAAQGQTFFAASGDNGAYDCAPNGVQALAVDSPASDPSVVGVGGTSLHTTESGAYVSESAWSNLSGSTAVGGGGGKSSYFSLPGYQSNPNNPPDNNRQVPDVSANADPETGYAIYYTSGQTNAPGWTVVGGTSAAAPLWAGIAADINQLLIAAHTAPLGHFSKTVYQLSTTPQVYAPYHDVTTGTNLYYKAVPGYDLATGLGTPDAWNIARDLQSAPALTAQLLQNAGFEASARAWQEFSKGGYELTSTANSHSGKYSAYFCSYPNCHDTLIQKAFLPSFSRRLTLSYWIYIGRGTTSTTCQNTFQVFLQTKQGQPITTVQKLCSKDANGWVLYSFDVTDALAKYVGQAVQLVFEANGSSEPRSNFFVNLDDINFQVLTSAPGVTTQMMQNPSFENGSAPWQESSKGGYELLSTSLAHTGTHSAYLCGYPNCNDSIAQTVTLPTSTRNVVLSYWTYIGRSVAESSCTDTFHVYLRVPAVQGTTNIPLHSLCSNDANGWVQFSFDILPQLMPYLGKPVQIGFNASGSSDPRANFFIDLDDILLYVTHS